MLMTQSIRLLDSLKNRVPQQLARVNEGICFWLLEDAKQPGFVDKVPTNVFVKCGAVAVHLYRLVPEDSVNRSQEIVIPISGIEVIPSGDERNNRAILTIWEEYPFKLAAIKEIKDAAWPYLRHWVRNDGFTSAFDRLESGGFIAQHKQRDRPGRYGITGLGWAYMHNFGV